MKIETFVWTSLRVFLLDFLLLSSNWIFSPECSNNPLLNSLHSSIQCTVFTSSSLRIYPTVITVIDTAIETSKAYFLHRISLYLDLLPVLLNNDTFSRALLSGFLGSSSLHQPSLAPPPLTFQPSLRGICRAAWCLLPNPAPHMARLV